MNQEEFQKETKENFAAIDKKLEKIADAQEKSNLIVETYQKSSQQVVNLAFGLLATSALAIIIPALLNK